MTTTIKRSLRAGAPRRPWRSLNRLTCVLVAVLGVGTAQTAMASTASASSSRASSHLRPLQQLAVLAYEHRAYLSPRTTARLQASVPAHRPITGEQTTLPVIGTSTDRHGQRWLKVMLPGRPNSSSGWIKRAGTTPKTTGWSILVNTGARHVWVYYRGQLTKDFSAVVGKASTPTPTGHFFIEETVIMPSSEPGGPYALALSARSNVLQEFDGGPGQIAIHGRDGLGGTPGQAESHGCMRLTTANIDWLAARVGPGTLVTIDKPGMARLGRCDLSHRLGEEPHGLYEGRFCQAGISDQHAR